MALRHLNGFNIPRTVGQRRGSAERRRRRGHVADRGAGHVVHPCAHVVHPCAHVVERHVAAVLAAAAVVGTGRSFRVRRRHLRRRRRVGVVGVVHVPAAYAAAAALLRRFHHFLVFTAPILEPDFHLSLRESEGSGQFGPFGQRQVLRSLEAPIELLQLQTRVDRPRLAHLLPLPVHADARLQRIISGW